MPPKKNKGASYAQVNKHGGRSGSNHGTLGRVQHPTLTADMDSFGREELNSGLPERFVRGQKSTNRRNEDAGPSSQISHQDIKLNLEIRKYMTEQENLRSTGEKDMWIEASEIPKSSEIHLTSGDVVLPANRIKKPFKTVESYLRTQYALLREDAISPLREAIDSVRLSQWPTDDASLAVYVNVHISRFTFTNMGIAARLKFSTQRAGRKILWSSSKRLISGSLVALTPAEDQFRTKCILAVIAARPLELLEHMPPEVDVYFSCTEDIEIDTQTPFLMVEAKQGYYEAYRHTLRAIQKLTRERSLEHVLQVCDRTSSQLQSVNVIDDWPPLPAKSTLDNSQWLALNQILTKKLAIVQGPPGTGKTHVSKVALEIMIRNRGEQDPPIIIAAQTNHALDQLLSHVSGFDPNYIRLGGRSTNSEVKQRALYEVRQRDRLPRIPGSLYVPAKKKLERAQMNLKGILKPFDGTSKVVPDDVLFKLGLINAAQQKSLVDAARRWVSSNEKDHNPVQYWLGDALIPFEVSYGEENFGFQAGEDEDLEIEQLRETEAEHGVADEEDIEMLHGPYIDVCDDWTVAKPSTNDISRAKLLLATKSDLWDIPERLRGAAYWVLKQRVNELALANFREAAKYYNEIAGELKIGRWERDSVYLKQANVIGMTTTGLSKYRPLIASLKPKVILIEEAAEVIEGPITAACIDSLEHLILIGDHKQLQGHCSVRELEDPPYHLAVSMFERLVNLNMPFRSLSRQRRMLPEVRQLITSLYPQLEDHESIVTRATPPPWGTGSIRSFFFNHNWSELKDETMSTYNEPEARMVARFYRHLLRHDIPPPGITILTFYNGQRRQILRELRLDPETNGNYNIVKTVDSYQGEENEIVILSLVRSNSEENVGFLNIDNRVCVALSRARQGFFIFGNGNLVSSKSDLWFHVREVMETANPPRYGYALPLTCIRHDRTTQARWSEDFDKNDGGCGQWCGSQLPCGHTCPKKCHPTSHLSLQCMQECGKTLSCGHTCNNMCHEECRCKVCNRPTVNQNSSGGIATETGPVLRQPLQHSDLGRESYPGGGNSSILQHRKVHAPSKPPKTPQRIHATPQPSKSVRPMNPPLHQSEQLTSTKKDIEHGEWSSSWASFTGRGAQANDTSHEGLHDPDHGGRFGDLIDLSPSEGSQDLVKGSEEEKMSGDRIRFTQTYQPIIPFGSGITKDKNGRAESAKSETGKDAIPNLMD